MRKFLATAAVSGALVIGVTAAPAIAASAAVAAPAHVVAQAPTTPCFIFYHACAGAKQAAVGKDIFYHA